MKLTTTKANLSAAMKQAVKVAHPKASMPILSHVAINFDGEQCTITANDSLRTYSATFVATGDPGQCTIEADKLARAVSGMKSGDIELTPDQVKQGRSKLKLESRNYSDFPQPDYDEADDAGITAESLSDAIKTVQHAMAMKDVRPMLNGVHLTAGHCVATDGHRMAVVDLAYTGPDIIIPSDAIRSMLDLDGVVKVSDRQIVIESESSRFTTNLIEAKFPDWRRVVPKEFATTATVNADDLLSAIKTVQLGSAMARFTFADGQLTIKNDEAESVVDCQDAPEGETAFNLQYVADAVQATGKAEVVIQVGSGAVGSSLIDGRFVVMPVRL